MTPPPRSPRALGVFAALVVVTSYLCLYEPLMKLAGNIKAH